MPQFNHLHVHTQFSLLDGAASIEKLFKKAQADSMRGLAITDHGNMFGVFKFVAEAGKYNSKDKTNIKPIVGCEFYVVDDRSRKQFTQTDKDVRYHQLLVAKNAEGYQNLVKLCSAGFIEGLYGKYPRIDKQLIVKYRKGLIATTCCLAAEVPKAILKKSEADAEEIFKWWLNLFGEDYYIELQRHGIPEQDKVNQVLLKWAAKHHVKVIASNDSHYVDREDSNAHDILLCLNTGEKQSTPPARDFDDETQQRGKRFAFYNDQFYLKSSLEMNELFQDVPEAIDNTNEIVDKVELLKLKQDILLPHFSVPPEYNDMDAYLHHLTMTGAKERYRELNPELEERIRFELFTIKTMGFAGYFLIVADFIKAGRDLGVFVGPGRGSAAGSVVAYCIGITNIDPIKYNLLFERFLNPDRKSMPDIDTDFDDEGRQKVIDYVVEKYGYSQVAQIVTYGTMAAKSSIKDVARVMDLPLPEANALVKLVPDRPQGLELSRLVNAPLEGEGSLREKENVDTSDFDKIKKLREIAKGNDLQARVVKEALVLEGSVRNVGIHAAGIIISPKELTEIIPVSTSKESNLLITQFEGKVIEDAGVIKMDLLGLKTLSIIRDTLILVKKNHGVELDIDRVPLDDAKTFFTYQRGETNGTFQFESVGMQKYLRELRPDKFEDLIAMNALYRPGPMEYIPDFIKRKHGKQSVAYDLPEMEEVLKETYGITVYQEQVMLLSQKLAGFTKGDADTLRKAMGKKQIDTLLKMKSKFLEGAKKFPAEKLEKIWSDWEKFASYAFNKSHSTCYALLAFQTAYLKTHFPAEYMAATLTHNLGYIEKITFFIEECRRLQIKVLGPDINESELTFSVNKKGEIRFGLAAIKGVGESAVEALLSERNESGPLTSIFDLARRVNSKGINKKTLESLAYSGAFDNLVNTNRALFFSNEKDGSTFIEKLIKYGNAFRENKNSNQHSLFGEDSPASLPEPVIPHSEPWSKLVQLKLEKDVIGFYISGHPLDNYRFELDNFCSDTIDVIKAGQSNSQKEFVAGVMITQSEHRIGNSGKPYGRFTIEDFSDNMQIAVFGEEYIKMKQYLEEGYFIQLKGRYQKSYRNPDQLEFKVTSLALLNELRDKCLKKMTFTVPLAEVNSDFIDRFSSILNKSKSGNGNYCQVYLNIVDEQENMTLCIPSKQTKLFADNNFLESLKSLTEIVQFTVNDKPQLAKHQTDYLAD